MACALPGFRSSSSREILIWGDEHNFEAGQEGEENAGESTENNFGAHFNRDKHNGYRNLLNSEGDLGSETCEGHPQQVKKVIDDCEYIGAQTVEIEDTDSVKVYSKDFYARGIFQALGQLRESSLLIDLTLHTENGQHLHGHSTVLSAVSSLVHQKLPKWEKKMERRDAEMKKQTEISISLGPEVGRVGLAAVLDFAYTGAIAALNTDTLAQIKAAATTLGVPRVLELCLEEEEKMRKGAEDKAEEKVTADEQMILSLHSIRQLWNERVGCDVELEAGGTSFHVHRVLLAASSDYFRGMFTSGMKESQQSTVILPFLKPSELEALIGCSYTGSIHLNWGRVFEITSTALQLQFHVSLSLCLDFLEQEMDEHSCLDVASFAEAYGMKELLEMTNDFVLRKFQNVAVTPKFQDLPAKKLRKYLKSSSLSASSELVLFKAIVDWIEACPSNRLKFTKELMKSVHFPLMTYNEFKEVKTSKLWTHFNTRCTYQSIMEDFHSYCAVPRTLCRVYMPKDSLVLVGGDQLSADFSRQNPSLELWFGNSLRNYIGVVKNVEWRLLTEMPKPPRLSHEVAVLAKKLYLIGGQCYSGRLNVLKSVYRYDLLLNSWERLADMQEKRCNFSIVVLKGMIYAIGGDTDPGTNLSSVEGYCPNKDSWSFAQPLDVTLSCHAATMLDGKLFISGGYHCRYQCLTSMLMYHPDREPTYLAGMSQPRAYHCMEALNGHLYVAGGVTIDENMTCIDQLTCEVYSIVSDSWSTFTTLHIPHVGAASVVLEEKLYVLGGYSKDNYREIRLVHRYDPTQQLWENMGMMPGPNTDIRACLLHLPDHLRK
ncbi:hypothetical protein UPYG_G00237090 [Umbra pygmaea]|uniref:BTB domain-containing protein n=1 Tax=Umbra pygmaea TaxID=75934 RepID=A0ABD0WG51_UMBPY